MNPLQQAIAKQGEEAGHLGRNNRPNKSRLKYHPHIESLEPRVVLDSTAAFNELMYHPSGDENSLEWIELHNQVSLDLDLSRWRLAGAAFSASRP